MSIAEESRSAQEVEVARPVNIAARLMQTAATIPSQAAVVEQHRTRRGTFEYTSLSFAEMANDVQRLTRGLHEIGITPGKRIVLMVKPSADFVALTFALFRAAR